ncbi:restriction endonuclease subunit S [Elizabethkingia anophelis]|uniref:restriction endonuclease subunit S n=1 Tax=Elizabethkingia TaxID=308865 RepID=UPI0021A74DCA|nr:restriction endonuclease subunit S [Elizabethkingia sp. HX YK]MCT3651805.1 restriction endonuclease subunit S [Elizabethkingia anophelis]MCT3659150.1 restriction endonuclease subunit S [Elizabethkingia anophelis]MCT3709316.1 restriction endonuclease subunit S [Elizabethkingia anophelis]MCT4115440.1 restriction endonuclease subunit S [Elizabethkingia anophelis]MCT4201054.1 restriction endonuclease subunit S [Elizabethkingia anophelis]
MTFFPNLRFPGFENEWEQITLGNCAYSFEYGMNASAIKFDGQNKYIRITDIDESSSKYKPDFPVSPNGQLLDKYLVSENDILFARTGASTGKSYLYHKDDGKLYFAGFLIRVKIKEEFNSYFVFIQTKTIQYYKWVQLMSMRSGQPGINSQEYASYSFNIPSKNEQNKISAFLSLIDERILSQKKIIEGLSLQKISIVKKLFENKIKFKTDNKTHSWERKKLSEISEEHLHKNPNNKYNEVFSVAKHKGVINQIEHLGRSFSAKEILHYKLVCPGDLVYTKSPTSDFPFGIIKQNRTGRIGVVSPLYCVFTPKTYALGYLLHEYFNSSVNTFNYLNPLVQKGAKNTMNINNEIFLNGASILLPMDEEEQKKIYEILLCLDAKINLETELLTQYENQKKYLLQNLFV